MGVYTDDDLDDLMKENIRLTRENNKLLKRMNRARIWGIVWKIVLLLIFVGVPYYLYRVYFEDYIAEVKSMYVELREDVTGLRELPSKFIP